MSNANLETLKKRHPNLPLELLEKVVKLNCRIMYPKERERFCTFYRQGLTIADVVKRMRIQYKTYSCTREAYPDFIADLKKIRKNRVKYAESQLYRSMLGKVYEVKITKIAKLDEFGDPVTNEGKQIFITTKKEYIQLAPNVANLQFYLKSKMPDVYGKQMQEINVNTLTTEQLKEEALKIYEAKKKV